MKTTLSRSIAVVAGAAVCLLASGLPASAAPGKVSHPAIKYFRASATSLPLAGGTVKLSTAVKGASACVFTSSPRLKGLPAKVSCTRGSATRTIRLPGNSAAGQKAYKFGLTVSGRGGKVAAKPLTVVVREAPPTITQIAVQPSDFPSAGGATVLSAKVSRSTKCTVSATPAVGGLPVTKACVAGSTSAGISIPVTLPALTGTTTRKYDISLKVSGRVAWHRLVRLVDLLHGDGPGRRQRDPLERNGLVGAGPDRDGTVPGQWLRHPPLVRERYFLPGRGHER